MQYNVNVSVGGSDRLVGHADLWHMVRSWSEPPTVVTATCGLELPGRTRTVPRGEMADLPICPECVRIAGEPSRVFAEAVAKALADHLAEAGLTVVEREFVEAAVAVADMDRAGEDTSKAVGRLQAAVERLRVRAGQDDG